MVQILFLMFLIGGTTQTSEPKRSQSTSSVDSGIGTSPVKRSFSDARLPKIDSEHFEPQTAQTITGPLSTLALLGYFSKHHENGVLRLMFKQPCHDSKTFRPVISSFANERLDGVTRVIIGPDVLSELHKEEIFEQLRRKNITVDFQY